MKIAACTSVDELRASMAPIWRYFGLPPTDEAVDNFSVLVGPERALAAWDDGAAVAGCCSFPFDLTTPGGRTRSIGGGSDRSTMRTDRANPPGSAPSTW